MYVLRSESVKSNTWNEGPEMFRFILVTVSIPYRAGLFRVIACARNPVVIQITRCCYGSFIARQWIRWIEWNLTTRKIDSIVVRFQGLSTVPRLSRNLFRLAIEFRSPAAASFRIEPRNAGYTQGWVVQWWNTRVTDSFCRETVNRSASFSRRYSLIICLAADVDSSKICSICSSFYARLLLEFKRIFTIQTRLSKNI